MKISLLKNTIQEYAWGSTRAIPDLLGRKNPEGKTQAELWMGAHPKAPSLVRHNGQWVSLSELIAKNPADVLGRKVARNFNNRLPYLFKVLAAARPLSIQAHPDLHQAREGFQRENSLKIPLDASHRNYRDDNHKPECICALSRFWALSRFRKISRILLYFEKLNSGQLEAELAEFKKRPTPNGLKQFYTSLITLDTDRRKRIVTEALEQARGFQSEDPVFRWMLKLAEDYPDDIGVLSPILLNLICLEPGQAMFLGSGQLHAYLEGTGIELMANSDNVLRGGLTPKHVDVSELLRILKFEDRDVTLLKPVKSIANELIYPGPAAEFVLSVITLSNGATYQSPKDRSVEILICTRGKVTLFDLADLTETPLPQGASAIVPACVERYRIEGQGTCYKAAVPLCAERPRSAKS
ncbi:MAG: mannose-6-phosphate isomerase, class I [Deltaproteobacteria bacterium]